MQHPITAAIWVAITVASIFEFLLLANGSLTPSCAESINSGFLKLLQCTALRQTQCTTIKYPGLCNSLDVGRLTFYAPHTQPSGPNRSEEIVPFHGHEHVRSAFALIQYLVRISIRSTAGVCLAEDIPLYLRFA